MDWFSGGYFYALETAGLENELIEDDSEPEATTTIFNDFGE
jgi:hypothetical protein